MLLYAIAIIKTNAFVQKYDIFCNYI